MIPEKLKARLTKDREMTTITLRMPVDVVDSLKAIAPHKGMSGYQALLRWRRPFRFLAIPTDRDVGVCPRPLIPSPSHPSDRRRGVKLDPEIPQP